MTLERAVNVFVEAFSQGKSRTYPYLVTHPEPWLAVMQDTPPRKNSRKIEVISTGGDPAQTVSRVQELNLGWHFLCEIYPDPSDFAQVRAEYKTLGYRAVSTEWMFVHSLHQLPDRHRGIPVETVRTPEELASIPQLASHKRHLQPGNTKFVIHDSTTDKGWVTHVPFGADHWVSALWVREGYRNQGLGRALMTELLHFAKERGDEHSVLLASSDGARLYPKLGYQQIAELQMFCPAKR